MRLTDEKVAIYMKGGESFGPHNGMNRTLHNRKAHDPTNAHADDAMMHTLTHAMMRTPTNQNYFFTFDCVRFPGA